MKFRKEYYVLIAILFLGVLLFFRVKEGLNPNCINYNGDNCPINEGCKTFYRRIGNRMGYKCVTA
jgi:hypothetical protein